MLKLIIEDDEGRKTVVPFVRDEITIGRQEGNTIRLTERNVSRHHARLVRQNGHILIEDLGSYNGTRINGEKIEAPSEIQDGDLVQIGDYDLALQSEAAANAPAPARAAPAARRPDPAEEAAEAEDAEEEREDTPPPSAPRKHSTAVIRVDQLEATRSRKVQDVDVEKAPRLVVLTSEFKGQEFACIRTEMRIGRTDENDIPLDHRSVSSTHAKVVREDNGEWRVIDMQSANGLTVNGETYAQSALKHGDVIELGHVKLRFVGAGKPVGSLNAGGGGSKLPMVLGILVVLAALGGGGFFFLKPRLFPSTTTTTPDTKTAEDPQQAKGPDSVKPPPQQEVKQADPSPTPPAGDSSAQQLAEKLQGAREAMKARNFEQAVDILESAKDASGSMPVEADTLLDEARAEQLAKKSIGQALKDIEAGKLDEAAAALANVVTKAQEQDLTDARNKLAAAKAAAAPTQAEAATIAKASELNKAKQYAEAVTLLQGCLQRDPKNSACQVLLGTAHIGLKQFSEAVEVMQGCLKHDPNNTECQEKLGSAHFGLKQFPEAREVLLACLKRDPNNAPCHMRIGSVYAAMDQGEQAVRHYRRFVELDPDNPSAAKVKGFLKTYEGGGQATNNQ